VSKRGRPFVFQKDIKNKNSAMEYFDSSSADLHLFVILFGMIFFFALHDFFEYLKNKDKNK